MSSSSVIIVASNQTPMMVSSCMYSSINSEKNTNAHQQLELNNNTSSWMIVQDRHFGAGRIAADAMHATTKDIGGYAKEDASPRLFGGGGPLKENNRKNSGYKHVPHRDKPAQVVARRNARERRRVQAVNGAFVRLRKAIPIENTRGKRISKVKTLQYAIDYIQNLQEMLEQDGAISQPYQIISQYYSSYNEEEFFDNFEFDDEL